MWFQIASVLFFHVSVCHAQPRKTACPKASVCKGCCAKDSHYAAQCAKISAEAECGKQIVCNWSDGPVRGTVYNAFDDFLNIDDDFYSCYESENFTSLTAYMATLQDDAGSSKFHHKRDPLTGACADCYTTEFGRKSKWRKTGNVAPGVIAYSFVDMEAGVAESSLNSSESITFYKIVTVPGDDAPGCVQADVSSFTAKLFGGKPGTCADEKCSTPEGSQHIPGCCTVQGFSCTKLLDLIV